MTDPTTQADSIKIPDSSTLRLVIFFVILGVLILNFGIFQGTYFFNKQKWQAANSGNYRIVTVVDGIRPERGATEMVVRENKIVSLDYSKTWCANCDQKHFQNLDIDGLFGRVARECGFGLFLFAYCNIDYHPTLGYPQSVQVHCLTLATDCDYYFRVNQLEFK